MKLGLIGYGKMGKTIERIAKERGHEIAKIYDIDNIAELENVSPDEVDAVIEFTRPDAAVSNISNCLKNGVKVVSGTTGWLEHKPAMDALCLEHKAAFLYGSNFSVGVNIFFKLNNILAKIMNNTKEYEVSMEEIHHLQKLDEPSGTAISLAEGILSDYDQKSNWKLSKENPESGDISIVCKREPEVPGTHSVFYKSSIDTIEIKHTAHSREGFALGAVVAAEWITDKEGVFSMQDVLNL